MQLHDGVPFILDPRRPSGYPHVSWSFQFTFVILKNTWFITICVYLLNTKLGK